MADDGKPHVDPVTGYTTTGHEWDGLTELNHALDRYRETMFEGDYELLLYDSPEEELRDEEEYLSPRPISLEFGGGHTFIVVQAALGVNWEGSDIDVCCTVDAAPAV